MILITQNYYFVDKTLLIKELLDKKGEANLFTRPRRFGKTLNLSMLRYFFEDTSYTGDEKSNDRLFDGLAIMQAGEKYTSHMGKYPVVFLSLKSAKQKNYEEAFICLKEIIAKEYARYENLVKEKLANTSDEQRYRRIRNQQAERAEYLTSLAFLSDCIYEATGKKSIILIDEYDVPLENAYFAGFYDEMVTFIRSLFESALKSNPTLEFAVIAGCLRISKESIFTGLNNLRIYSVLSDNYDEYFGFTEQETADILESYGQQAGMQIVKEWYDGYRFGNTEVYNPWSIVNYIQDLQANPHAFPTPYWANTSSNSIVKELVEQADLSVKEELECLMQGGTIEKAVHEDITYDSIYESDENLWSFLFFTGYLKQCERRLEGANQYVTMAIPNTEVRYIYENTIQRWFAQKQKGYNISVLYTAMEQGDTARMESEITGLLEETISYYDYNESYYHGFLTGILKQNQKYLVVSNRETGLGRTDIVLRTQRIRGGKAIILELKAVHAFRDMENGVRKAVQQIEEKRYATELERDGYREVLKYGICFYKKECMVVQGAD